MKREKTHYQEFASINPTYTSFYSRPINNTESKNSKFDVYQNCHNCDVRRKEENMAKIYNCIDNEVQYFCSKCYKTREDNRSLKRLQKSLHYLIMTAPEQYVYCKERKRNVKFKLNFITLTIANSNGHNDTFIKANLLDRFLKWIVYKGTTGYVWKAEAQKRGTIHFHITANKYIHWKDIKAYWNALQQRYGCLNAYFTKYGHYNANSTDVHAVKNEDKAMRYMSKYLMKAEPDKREIVGHKFGYSRNLANIKLVMETNDPEFDSVYNYLRNCDSKTVNFDYVTCMYHNLIDISKCPSDLSEMILQAVKPKVRKGAVVPT